MTRVICIASGKGGSGKTTMTANIGIALAEKGLNVLLVDADVAMANLSLLLGLQASPITLHNVLLGEAGVSDAIYDGPKGVKFIPSGLSLQSYRRVDPEKLKDVINPLKSQFDFILLDAPAGVDKTVLAALNACDELLLITEPTSPAVADAFKTKMIAQRLGKKPIGVIINFVRGEKGEITDLDIMKMLELPVYAKIPEDPDVRRSFMQEKVSPILVWKPEAKAAIAMAQAAFKLAGLKEEAARPKGEGFITKLLNKLKSLFKKK
ncbi:AAA family ATPase [archaeon]|nr:AAA family ATPase [archaeon]